MSAPPTTAVHRLCYAAAHVALDDGYARVNHTVQNPGNADEIAVHIDWDTTMALRTRLDGLGFGIAEAMDTAQRFALGWPGAQELMKRCAALNLENGFVAGAGYDQNPGASSQAELVDAVVDQGKFIESIGGEVIVLPMPWLTAHLADAETYVDVYRAIVEPLDGPVYIHWLGEAFMPALKGYFPNDSFERVMALDAPKIRGVKISLLDADRERQIRSALMRSEQIVLTGDDFNFGGLIRGDDQTVQGTIAIGNRAVAFGEFSHALLGVLDAVAEPVSRALDALERGDLAAYDAIMAPCEELGRWIFQTPTQFYKSGLAFLAWANGLQSNPMLVNHEERNRPRSYYERTLELAERAGAVIDSATARERLAEIDRYLAP
jgi:dihydrodipicolinate synthase/N-acetylneuraminate lyase